MINKIQRFQRILTTREKIRDEERLFLSEARNHEDRVLLCVKGLQQQKQEALSIFEDQEGQVFSPQDMWYRRKAIDVIEEEIHQANEALQKVRESICQSEERLVEKHKEVRIMEKYVGKLRYQYREFLLLAEQEELDDIASVRHVEKMGE